MTEEQLQACARWWQKQLGLTDWDIRSVKHGSPKECRDCSGACQKNDDMRTARIIILRHDEQLRLIETDEDWDCATPDEEQTLVHELLHLRLWCYPWSGSIEQSLKENAIEELAKSFVKIRRQLQCNGSL